jgi:hypothetical protein
LGEAIGSDRGCGNHQLPIKDVRLHATRGTGSDDSLGSRAEQFLEAHRGSGTSDSVRYDGDLGPAVNSCERHILPSASQLFHVLQLSRGLLGPVRIAYHQYTLW